MCFLLASFALVVPLLAKDETQVLKPVSFFGQIRPLFQANCNGCHQPAKSKGDYVMTDFASLLKGGDSGEPAVVPGKPAESSLLALVTPDEKGEYEMPKGKNTKPLHETEINLLRRWIEEGAKDDSPANSGSLYSMENPPEYVMPPVV
ncbi:MAG TPA: hypothetical protein DCG39_02740, partial [Opitutae bacterium]|nr:hypothetical protein [Opitutae bacterium]